MSGVSIFFRTVSIFFKIVNMIFVLGPVTGLKYVLDQSLQCVLVQVSNYLYVVGVAHIHSYGPQRGFYDISLCDTEGAPIIMV